MREIIDNISPSDIKPVYKTVFNKLQRGKELSAFRFMGDYYLVSGDGSEYFNSETVHCPHCMERQRRNGKTQYYHQFYAAAIVHPDLKQVIPLAPEAIQKQDGDNKNDCERNASKRFFKDFRKDHPKLKAIIVEDALASNAPHVELLKELNLDFILGTKDSGNKYLFERLKAPQAQEYSIIEGNITHTFKFINNISLNENNPNTKVNFFEYWEIDNKTDKQQHFSWITTFNITTKNIYDLMRGGRARWKIENETFNTLKNQEYCFKHNFGHGNNSLSENFSLLMMLAFLIDQSLELACPLFKAAMAKYKTKIKFWEKIRRFFDAFIFESLNQIYEAIYIGIKKNKPYLNTS